MAAEIIQPEIKNNCGENNETTFSDRMLFFSITCQAEDVPKTVLQQLEGVWTGLGVQNNNSKWSIKVTIHPERLLNRLSLFKVRRDAGVGEGKRR